MDRKWTISLAAAAVMILVLAVFAEPALAADPAKAGQNVGDLIRGLFAPIVGTIGGVIGVAAIVKRDYVLALMLVGLTIIVLGFFVEPSPYETWGIPVVKEVFSSGGTIGFGW